MKRVARVLGVIAVSVLLAGCGGSGSSSSVAEHQARPYAWNVSDQEIRELISEIEPYEVIPGCNPGKNTQIDLSKILEERVRGERTKAAIYEREFRRSEEEGPLIPTASQEEHACFKLQEIEIKHEGEKIRAGQELEAEEAQREERAREAAREREQELGAEGEDSEQGETPMQENYRRKLEEQEAREGKREETAQETAERFAEEGGDGPG